MKLLTILMLLFVSSSFVTAVGSLSTSFGTISSGSGTVTYSIGNSIYQTISGTGGTATPWYIYPYAEDDASTAIEESEQLIISHDFYAAPNPVTSLMKVIGLKDNETFSILNTPVSNYQNKTIDISQFPKGVYFLITSKGRQITFYKK